MHCREPSNSPPLEEEEEEGVVREEIAWGARREDERVVRYFKPNKWNLLGEMGFPRKGKEETVGALSEGCGGSCRGPGEGDWEWGSRVLWLKTETSQPSRA
jgi:hypothetical protein